MSSNAISQYAYVGCFVDQSNIYLTYPAYFTVFPTRTNPTNCYTWCAQLLNAYGPFDFFGITLGTTCYCGIQDNYYNHNNIVCSLSPLTCTGFDGGSQPYCTQSCYNDTLDSCGGALGKSAYSVYAINTTIVYPEVVDQSAFHTGSSSTWVYIVSIGSAVFLVASVLLIVVVVYRRRNLKAKEAELEIEIEDQPIPIEE